MIIVYGGSFNPPTIAHYEIASYLIERYAPKRFIFVPVGNSYQKPDLVPFQHRYNMLEILCEKLDGAEVSRYENQPSFSGTIDLLTHFEKHYQQEIYFVLGADNLLKLHRWIDYEQLVQQFKFIILNRSGVNVESYINEDPIINQYRHHFQIETEFERLDVAASDYRNNQQDTIVLKSINNYIYTHNLYQRGERHEE